MAATARDGASPAAAPDPERPARRLGRRVKALVTVLAAASLAVTGYACALAGIDGVAAIRGMGSDRPSPGKGVVSGISSFVGSSAFAAALSSASAAPSVAASRDASGGRARPGTPTARDSRDCLPAAAACVDLTGRIPWLQDDGTAGFGPVLPSPARS
ncbi:MAG: hypothetical protein JWM19_1403 [Actinomycetia bacterium]|nr:hypothetical protein [Actinomycetes bacterium]